MRKCGAMWWTSTANRRRNVDGVVLRDRAFPISTNACPGHYPCVATPQSNVVSIEAGDRAGLLRRRDGLVLAHLELVRSIAHGVAATLPATFDIDDLISTGYVGLLRAATNYRPAVHGGAPFSAYARPVIHGAIVDSVRRGKYIENTRASVESITERVGPVADREGDIDRERRRGQLRRAVASLDARHSNVIAWHYDDEERLPEVGRRLGVGKSRASQIHCEALEELREKLAA
jgi:RNA polymerase sigma factor (sigma-70 family)